MPNLFKLTHRLLIGSIIVIIFFLAALLAISYFLSPRANVPYLDDFLPPSAFSPNPNIIELSSSTYQISPDKNGEGGASSPTDGPVINKPSSSSPAGTILHLGSFAYSSSNFDVAKSTLHFDNTASIISFPPDYDWRFAGDVPASIQQSLESFDFNDSSGPYQERRCLGADCLEQKGNSLYYNGRAVRFPAGIDSSNLAAVSIGSLTRRFLVGFTLKNTGGKSGEIYRGLIYYFEAGKFTEIKTPKPISSRYFGLFGFGGEEGDFLAIYGGYQGIAYRIRGSSLLDISKFFSMKVMANGFKPEVVRTTAGPNVNWYIFSLSSGQPQLIKLWQNGSPDIVGQIVFSDFFREGDKSAAFKLAPSDSKSINFFTNIKDKYGKERWYLFSDRGFKNTGEGFLKSLPIICGRPDDKISIQTLAESKITVDEPSRNSVKLLFSKDGNIWQAVPLGENKAFPVSSIDYYFLKVVFSGESDRFYSPAVSSIFFDYYFQK